MLAPEATAELAALQGAQLNGSQCCEHLAHELALMAVWMHARQHSHQEHGRQDRGERELGFPLYYCFFNLNRYISLYIHREDPT